MDSCDKLLQIGVAEIKELLQHFSQQAYLSDRSDRKAEHFLDVCETLWKQDYNIVVIENSRGDICPTYPSRFFVPVSEVIPQSELPIAELQSLDSSRLSEPLPATADQEFFSMSWDNSESTKNDFQDPGKEDAACSKWEDYASRLKAAMYNARRARCRFRFAIPSIMCSGQYICRSATLSCMMEIVAKYIGGIGVGSAEMDEKDEDYFDEDGDIILDKLDKEGAKAAAVHMSVCDKARMNDKRLLRVLRVNKIFNLMLEDKKKKGGINVSSSERADKAGRYRNFMLFSLPYPGCEFFKEFTRGFLRSEDLYFDWEQSYINIGLNIPDSEKNLSSKVTKDWLKYKSWDLRQLTENYLKLILASVYEGSSGILVHCISGWDRTPLFISLIRLSLWADGLIHSSLSPLQMLYLTLAYDWLLFGHLLSDRVLSNENIMYFCFEFLDRMYNESYVTLRNRNVSDESGSSSSYVKPPFTAVASSLSLDGCSRERHDSHDFEEVSPHECSNGDCSLGKDAVHNTSNGFVEVGSSGSVSDGDEASPAQVVTFNAAEETVRFKHGSPVVRHRETKDHLHSSPKSDVSSLSNGEHSPSSSVPHTGISSSLPVPVPRRSSSRVRTDSDSLSSSGSWQFISTSGTLKDAKDVLSSKLGQTYQSDIMSESTQTVRGKCSPGSSVDSSQSIIIFNREKRLREVKEAFMKCYGEVPHLQVEAVEEACVLRTVSCIANKVGLIQT